MKSETVVTDSRFSFYIIENCSEATGHRSVKLYDAVCPDKCRALPAFNV